MKTRLERMPGAHRFALIAPLLQFIPSHHSFLNMLRGYACMCIKCLLTRQRHCHVCRILQKEVSLGGTKGRATASPKERTLG